TKYHKLISFARALPKIRRTIRRHLRLRGLPREKVLAAVIAIMEKTLVRVGNEEYAKQNRSFGLTTMRNNHANVSGSKVRFRFRGKSGQEHDIDFSDPRLAKIIRRCQDLPGHELFEYINGDGTSHDITSTDVNEYLRNICGEDFTAKDFRTWAGTVLAAEALAETKHVDGVSKSKRDIVAAVDLVAKRLGNTRSVSRKCYIHPAVIDAWIDGSLANVFAHRANRKSNSSPYKLSSH